ncbi:MAG: dihydroorotate dehydrogenase [Thermoguttaceae bacterium]
MSPVDLRVSVAGFSFPNPILVASGTFGYAREMESVVDLSRLGGIVPKTVTLAPRAGNAMPRTVETASGMLNAIGLDNDGIDAFLRDKLPYLLTLGTPIVISLAAKEVNECAILGEKVNTAIGELGERARNVAAVEMNISCPNVSGGVDYATDAKLCEEIVGAMRRSLKFPLWVKLSPNVTRIAEIAAAAENAGADAIVAINTCLGMAIDWRRRRPRLANVVGGLSGPATKPIALRCVYQIADEVKIPVVGVGGIATIDDAMEFFVAGASLVQVGTANFFDPRVTMTLVDALPAALAEAGVSSVREIVKTLVR